MISGVFEALRQAVELLGTTYPHAWIGDGTDHTTGQDVALMSKFPAVSQPIRAYPDERESYDSDQNPGGETDTGLSKVLRVNLDVGGGTTFTVLVMHLNRRSGTMLQTNSVWVQANSGYA